MWPIHYTKLINSKLKIHKTLCLYEFILGILVKTNKIMNQTHRVYIKNVQKNNKEMKEFDQTPNNKQVGHYKSIKNLYRLYAITELSLGI